MGLRGSAYTEACFRGCDCVCIDIYRSSHIHVLWTSERLLQRLPIQELENHPMPDLH